MFVWDLYTNVVFTATERDSLLANLTYTVVQQGSVLSTPQLLIQYLQISSGVVCLYGNTLSLLMATNKQIKID